LASLCRSGGWWIEKNVDSTSKNVEKIYRINKNVGSTFAEIEISGNGNFLE
jgi:hypothetical protein